VSAPADHDPWEPRPLPDHPHGVLRAVAIPESAPPPAVLARLTSEERAFAAQLVPFRQRTWVAGRLALAAALAAVGAPRTPILATARDAPAPPPGFVGSVSHKKHLAVALAAPDEGAHLGVDVEDAAPLRYDIAPKILTAAELLIVDALPPEARWRAVVARFSIKESMYKAVDPFVRRYVAFMEAEVDLGPPARARFLLSGGEGPFAVEATWTERGGLFVTTARVRRDQDAQR
jgi:enterobactin synthetase component D